MKLQNSFPAGSFLRENWLHFFSFFSTALSISFKFHPALSRLAFGDQTEVIAEAANVDAIFFCSNRTFDLLRNVEDRIRRTAALNYSHLTLKLKTSLANDRLNF